MDNFITVSLGSSFLLNAGICGLLEFLYHNEAKENTDYKIDDQTLYISTDFLKQNNIPEMYINTMAELLEKTTKFYRITELDRQSIDNLNNTEIENLTKDQLKRLNEKYTNFQQKFMNKSYINAYKLLSSDKEIKPVTEDLIIDFKKCKDLNEKYKKYNNIIQLIGQKKVKNTLIYTELIYTQFKLFFAENSQSKKITCLCNAEQKYEETYGNSFYLPLIQEMEISENKKSISCIECRNPVSAKNKKAFTFLCDTADDVNRKKSYYWNCKPDAFVCPVCAFVYSFIPLGFVIMGNDAVFINNNGSIKSLYSIMKTCRAKSEDDNNSIRHKVLRTLTSEKINSLENVVNNIEVIMNSFDYSHFRFDVIDINTVNGLTKGKKYITRLENKWIKPDNSDLRSVYDMVLDCIFYKRDLYYPLNKLMKFELSKDNNLGYLKNILRLEIIFNGGSQMNELNEKVDLAFYAGKRLRKSILGENAEKDNQEDDNKLRSFVYRLVNLTSVGDREQFIDTVVRIYSGFNLTIPSIFKDCYVSDEMFKAISHGFILGLKYVPYKKENKEVNYDE